MGAHILAAMWDHVVVAIRAQVFAALWDQVVVALWAQVVAAMRAHVVAADIRRIAIGHGPAQHSIYEARWKLKGKQRRQSG